MYAVCTGCVRPVTPPQRRPISQAAITAMFRMSFAVETVEQIWIGLFSPVRIGPITVAPAISCISFTEIDAECRAGTTSTLAGPDSRVNG